MGLVGLVVVVLAGALILVPIIAVEQLIGGGGGTTTEIGPGSPIPSGLVPVFNSVSRALDVNPYLLASVAKQESDFSSEGVNSSGCAGFMQMGLGGACGDSWDSSVALTADPAATVVARNAYQLGTRPSGYPGETSAHPSYNDPFDAVMAGAVWLRSKVGGKPIPNLDNTAYQALCGYYGACADAIVNYAQDVYSRAQLWQSESALTPGLASTAPLDVSGYVDPFAKGSVVNSERIDQGVDYALTPGEPIGAIGLAQVKGVIGNWYDGQPLIWYQLLSGLYRGKYVYVAEQLDRLAVVGQQLLPGQPVAYYAPSGTGIETGWALADGETLARANGGYTEGRSTAAGASFRRLLQGVGAPTCDSSLCGLNTPFQGTVPAGYP